MATGSAFQLGSGRGWRSARELVSGPLRTLLVGQSFGQAGDGLAQIAFAQVAVFEAGRGATPQELTAVLAVTLLPFSLVGPVAGVLIDRWDRRRVMAVTSLLRALLAVLSVAVVVAHSRAVAYAGILLLLSSSRFVQAAKGAALPRTVGTADLVTANALSSVAGLSAAFLGAVAGSAFVATVPAAGFLTAAAAYLAAAAAFTRLPPVGGGTSAPLRTGLARLRGDLSEELRVVTRVAAVRRPLSAVLAYRMLLGGGFVLLVLIANSRYQLEAPGYGLALAVTGVAAFAGTVAAPMLARRHDPAALLPLAFVVGAAAALGTGFGPILPVAVIGVGLSALAFQVLKVSVDALVQRAARDQVRGRVFAAYDLAYNIAFVLAGLLLIPLWAPGRERALLWRLAVGFLLAGALLAWAQRSWPFAGRSTGSGLLVALRARPGPPGRWRWRWLAAAAGAVLALAFPEPSVWWLGFVGLVPLLLVVHAARSAREAALRGWWGGGGFLLLAHYWLAPNLGPFLLVFVALLAAAWLPWAWLAWAALRAPLSVRRLGWGLAMVPAAWVAAEFVRSWERLGGPWSLLGASQWANRPVLSLAALGGVWLVGAVLAAVNLAVAAAVLALGHAGTGWWTRLTALAVAAGLVLAAFTVGQRRPVPPARGHLLVAGVQPGVISPVAPRFAASERATQALAPARPDLVVWGESSVGTDPYRTPSIMDRLVVLSRLTGADLLVNVDARRSPGAGVRKSALLVGPTGPGGRYDKMRLVPFGEYIPLRPLLSWVDWMPGAPSEDRQRGRRQVLLATAGVRVGPLICFESAFPDLSRQLAADGADLVIVQSATTTFQDSWAPAQHASLAAVRAVETGRTVLHATLSGTSAAFDASGRRLLWFGTHRRGSYLVDVPVSTGTTPYVRFGDWVPAGSFLMLLAGVLTAGLAAARKPEQPQPGPPEQPAQPGLPAESPTTVPPTVTDQTAAVRSGPGRVSWVRSRLPPPPTWPRRRKHSRCSPTGSMR